MSKIEFEPASSRLSNDQSMFARDVGGSRTSKVEKERHKKNYDPNVFFKVNGETLPEAW